MYVYINKKYHVHLCLPALGYSNIDICDTSIEKGYQIDHELWQPEHDM